MNNRIREHAMSSAFPQITSLTELMKQTYEVAQNINKGVASLATLASQNSSTLMQFVPGIHQYRYLKKFIEDLGLTIDNFDIIVVNLKKKVQISASSTSFVDVVTSFLAGNAVSADYVNPFSSNFGGYAFSLRALVQEVESDSNSPVTKMESPSFKYSYLWGTAKDFFSSLLTNNSKADLSFVIGGVGDPSAIWMGVSLPSSAYPNSPVMFSIGVKFDPNKDTSITSGLGALQLANIKKMGVMSFADLDSYYDSLILALLPAIRDKNNKYVYPFPVCMWNAFIGAVSYIRKSADYVGTSGTPDSDYVAVTNEGGIPVVMNTTGNTKFVSAMLPPYSVAPVVVSIYGASRVSLYLIPVPPYMKDMVPENLASPKQNTSSSSSTSGSSSSTSTSSPATSASTSSSS